jgi:EpsI family protein
MNIASDRSLEPGARAFLMILVAGFVVALLQWRSFSGIASMWSLMPYRHGYLMFPAAAYFIWHDRDDIGSRPIRGSWVGCIALLVLTSIWVIARATAVQAVEQVATVLMIPAMVLAAFGPEVFRSAAFPLLLIVAAVPVGETLLPGLMTISGDIAERLLMVLRVPVYRQGNVIGVPSGSFRVADVCAGLNTLLAGVVTAIVFAHQSFAAWRKRLLFVAVAAAAFVLANGVRVFLVIYLSDLSGGRIFAHDHVWLGTVVFGVIMAILLVVGSRLSDRVSTSARVAAAPSNRQFGVGSIVAALVGAAIVATGPLLAARAATSGASSVRWPPLPALSECEGPGQWAAGWGPFMVGADLERSASYACGNVKVSLYVALYVQQQPGKELISSQNELVPDYMVARGRRSSGEFRSSDGHSVEIDETSVGGESPQLIWHWFSVGASSAASEPRVKLLEAMDTLRLRQRSVSAVYVVAVSGTDERRFRPVAERAAHALWDSSHSGRVGGAGN